MAPKNKKPGTALVKWEEELAKDAELQSKISNDTGSGGNWLSIKGGRLSYQGEEIQGGAINAVVIGFVYENQYYNKPYDPSVIDVPVCYAFGESDENMAPHKEASEPQFDQCTGCPLNEFGSAQTGKGKACKNVVRLALIPEAELDDLGALETLPVAFLKVPPTSRKAWNSYAKKICQDTDGNKPTFFFITKIRVHPDPKTQVRVEFSAEDTLKNRPNGAAEYKALKAKALAVKGEMMAPYPKPEDIEQPKPKARTNQKFAPKARR